MKKIGFTLAEVLITLVIVGVIVALTIPTLYSYTNSYEYRSAAKKALSTINNAMNLLYIEEGGTASDYPDKRSFYEAIKPKMSVIEEENPKFSDTLLCGTGQVFTTVDGIMYCITWNYRSEVATSAGNANSACTRENLKPCVINITDPNLYIDVNGLKKPNKLTKSSKHPRDIYQFQIYSQKVVPLGEATQDIIYNNVR